MILPFSCSPSQDFDLSASQLPIFNGSPDTNPAHMAVVYLDTGSMLCTGTLISPEVVVTAGHCLDRVLASRVSVGFGSYTSSYGGGDMVWYQASEVDVHPSYFGGDSYTPPRNDIALLRLSSNAPAEISPIPILPANLALTGADIGQDLEYVGFGDTETGASGTKLTYTATLNWVCTDPPGCAYDGGNVVGAPNTIGQSQQDGGTCVGDSGGPAFFLRSGKEYLAGVTSYGDMYCVKFGFSTKVDEFEAFIYDFVGGQGQPGDSCSADALCLSSHCVDGVCCDTACADVCASCSQAGSLGTCTPLANGGSCADGNMCNGAETCQAGVCVSGSPLQCDDANPCTSDSCQADSGCVNTIIDCSDGNLCNGTETCQAGTCVPGTALNCQDENQCTDEACDMITGCLHEPLANGLLCSTENQCLEVGSCQNGICQPGEQISCDDHNQCTQDLCAPDSGCVFSTLPDGSTCGGGVCGTGVCAAGICQSSQMVCDDNNPCTLDWCDPIDGCKFEPVPDHFNQECGNCMICRQSQCVEWTECPKSSGGGCNTSGAHGLGLFCLLILFLRWGAKCAHGAF